KRISSTPFALRNATLEWQIGVASLRERRLQTMIIVDNALKARAASGKPIQVGMIGAGFMGRGIANQIVNSVPGMRLAAIANRTVAQAARAYIEAGAPAPKEVTSANELDDAIRNNDYAITQDPAVVCQAEGIDAIIEVTGA